MPWRFRDVRCGGQSARDGQSDPACERAWRCHLGTHLPNPFRARPARAPGHAGSAFPGGCLSAARGSGSSPLSFQAGPGVCGEGVRLLTVFGFSSLFHVVVSELQPLDSPWVSTATVSERGCRAGARVGEPRPASSSSHRPSAAARGFSPAWRSTGVPFRLLCSSRSHFMFKNVFYARRSVVWLFFRGHSFVQKTGGAVSCPQASHSCL